MKQLNTTSTVYRDSEWSGIIAAIESAMTGLPLVDCAKKTAVFSAGIHASYFIDAPYYPFSGDVGNGLYFDWTTEQIAFRGISMLYDATWNSVEVRHLRERANQKLRQVYA